MGDQGEAGDAAVNEDTVTCESGEQGEDGEAGTLSLNGDGSLVLLWLAGEGIMLIDTPSVSACGGSISGSAPSAAVVRTEVPEASLDGLNLPITVAADLSFLVLSFFVFSLGEDADLSFLVLFFLVFLLGEAVSLAMVACFLFFPRVCSVSPLSEAIVLSPVGPLSSSEAQTCSKRCLFASSHRKVNSLLCSILSSSVKNKKNI